jgi:hypothetical protein
MNPYPTLSKEMTENSELRARISLSNRPRLGTGLERLNEVSMALAANDHDRHRFIANPASYLNEQAIAVSSCSLAEAKQPIKEQDGPAPLLLCIINVCAVADSSCVLDCNPVVVMRLQGMVAGSLDATLRRVRFEQFL